MKKVISFVLIAVMIFAAIPTVSAAGTNTVSTYAAQAAAELEAAGYDPDNYTVLELGERWGSLNAGHAGPNSVPASGGAANPYYSSKVFDASEFPAGTLIWIADGYTYRAHGWSSAYLRDNGYGGLYRYIMPKEGTSIVIVDDAWHDERISYTDDSAVTLLSTPQKTGKQLEKRVFVVLADDSDMSEYTNAADVGALRIYIPKQSSSCDMTRVIPEDIYEEPYRESQYTTVYSPWLKMYHILSEEEAAAGLNGADGCQLIRAFDVSPVDKNVMYMMTDTTGVWKTTDGGQLWYNVSNNINDVYGVSVLCDKNDVDTVYAYTSPSGVWKSTDGGRNWTKLISEWTHYQIFNAGRFAQDDAGNTYIAASSGIYKLEAGSDKLINLYSKYNDLIGNESTLFGDIYVSGDGQDIYVAGAYSSGYIASSSCYVSGLYISNDGGATWEIKNIYKEFDSSATGSSVLSITVDPANENRILVLSMKYDTATKKEGGTTELFESLDGGKSFVHVGNCSYALQIRIGPKNASGVSPIYVQRGNDATFKGLQVSYDGGKTFSAMVSDAHSMRENTWYEGNGNGHYGYWFEPFVIDYTKEDTIYTAAYGIQKYEKGTWTWIGAGFSGASVIQYTMDDNGNMILIMTDVGVSISTAPYTEDSYATFERAYTEVLTMIAVDPNNSKHIIGFTGANNTAAGKQLGIVISNNGGQTFGGIVAAATRNTAVLEYVGNNTIYTSEYYSTDNGNTWKKTKYFIYDICDADPNRMIAIDKTNNMVMLSTNGGSTWTAVVELKFADAYIDLDMMRFDVANKNKVWYSDIRSFGYIDLATNTKVDLVSKFEYKNFTYFAQNPNNPDHIIVTTLYAYSNAVKDPKVYETRDGGKTWHVVPGFFGGYTQSVFFSKTTDEVFIGGHMGTMIYDYKAYWEYLDKQ